MVVSTVYAIASAIASIDRKWKRLSEFVRGWYRPDMLAVYRAQLPTVDRLLPYLATLDRTRNYSNHGDLHDTLGERLSRLFFQPHHAVTLASSGTAALIGAILATAGRATVERPVCLIPAYTFCATAAAAESCGYTVRFSDVDEESLSLTPELISNHPDLGATGLIIPVCPFGRAVEQGKWLAFSRRTSVPVVIDAAASFESISTDPSSSIGDIPIALSFHATKPFSTGEGGAVVCADSKISEAVRRSLNFGMWGGRSCASAGVNGKLSEYHAAVGLAELDHWHCKQTGLLRSARLYHDLASGTVIADRLLVHPEVASCYALYRSSTLSEASIVKARLGENGIGHRLWYGSGLQNEPYYASTSNAPVPTTESIAPRLLGIPTAPDLTDGEAERVISTLINAVS